MRHEIIIQRRTQSCDNITDIDYIETFEDVATVRAAVNTNRGYRSFNQVGTNQIGAQVQAFTHRFYIRFFLDCVPSQ